MKEELISKKQLLRAMQISYGTLYRWKREGLIPEKWFIHKATDIGQATFFPREKIISRITKIKELKSELTVEQMKDVFSSNDKHFSIPMSHFVSLGLVSKLSITAFTIVYPTNTVLANRMLNDC